jgi:hypothetical protein
VVGKIWPRQACHLLGPKAFVTLPLVPHLHFLIFLFKGMTLVFLWIEPQAPQLSFGDASRQGDLWEPPCISLEDRPHLCLRLDMTLTSSRDQLAMSESPSAIEAEDRIGWCLRDQQDKGQWGIRHKQAENSSETDIQKWLQSLKILAIPLPPLWFCSCKYLNLLLVMVQRKKSLGRI